jgi:peptidoglycan/LPS O-acetylase OafA/YrhL
MFLTGACLYAFSDRVPMSGHLALLSACTVAVGGYLPDYRIIAAPALTYLIFWIAARLRHPRWNRTTDLSFGLFLFGFPVQQTLLVLGWPWLHPAAFFVVSWLATVPFALVSWFAIERPAMRWKRHLDRAPDRASSRRGRRPVTGGSAEPAADQGAVPVKTTSGAPGR